MLDLAFGEWQFDGQKVFSLARCIRTTGTEAVDAFGIHQAQKKQLLSIEKGDNVNCWSFSVCPHTNATHTENASHVFSNTPELCASEIPDFMLAVAVVLKLKHDLGNCAESVEIALDLKICEAIQSICMQAKTQAAILLVDKSPPTHDIRCHFAPKIAEFLLGVGVEHLVTNLPSVDPREDGGKLAFHRAFFGQSNRRTITELCHLPATLCLIEHSTVQLVLLQLNVADMEGDCSLSFPKIYLLK